MIRKIDPGIDSLLALDGWRVFVDEEGLYEVIFSAVKTDATKERPHGLKYSLVLLDAKGQRIVAFDNAHAIKTGSGPGKKTSRTYDHKHLGERITPYPYTDAGTLLEDFWTEVYKAIDKS